MVKEHIGKISGRKVDSHKGDYGKVFVVAGSPGMTGAAYLSSQAAAKAGSGLVTNGIPASLNEIMEIKLTEVMTIALDENKSGCLCLASKDKIIDFSKKCDVVVIGPGIGSDTETGALVKVLLAEIDLPVVLDADGLNALEGDISILKDRASRTVITPHPGELSRLTGVDVSSIQSDRMKAAKNAAEETGAVVCLKGHRTVVAGKDGQIYVNDTGNSGMATGGSGDILTGMIASFIGQGIDDFSAAVSSVYLHGIAGDIAAERKGQFSMIATDILDSISDAFKKADI